VVRSDHQAIRWLLSVAISDVNPRLVRWRLALSTYNFEVKYKPGKTQKVADALSLLPTEGMALLHTEEYKEDIPTLTLDVDPPPHCSVIS
jgi:hypothetical protein